jgi:Domain of unknown function (DUF1996)
MMRFVDRSSLALVALAIVLCGTVEPASAQELAPNADAVARGDDRVEPSGGRATSLLVSNSAFGRFDRWSYLRFELRGIKHDIVRATLALSVRDLDGDTALSVTGADDAWSEHTLRWRNRPMRDKTLATLRVPARGDRELLIDVTDYVRAQAASDGQASFALHAPNADERNLRLHSRESAYSPVLVIDTVQSHKLYGRANTGATARTQHTDGRSERRAPAMRTSRASAPSEPTSWTLCAEEGQRCRWPGGDSPAVESHARYVRYGAAGRYVVRAFLSGSIGNSLPCSAHVFFGRDPAPGQSKRCEYSSPLVTELPAPTNPMGPAVDRTLIPVGDPGTAQVLTRQTSEQPGASDGTGAFRIVCMYSHMNFDDALVYPGQPGRSHLHAYFGNTGADAHSTPASLRHSGNTTCNGGILNRSAYWVPAVIDTRSGRPIAPRSNIVYYKTGYSVPPATIQPFPNGLRMIAGDMLASSEQEFASWSCGEHTLRGGAIPPNCPAGQDLTMNLLFPQCWDGVNLDSPNHKSHMAYPREGRCPASHPIPLPEISYNVHYNVPDSTASTYWRLSSDMYGADKRGGFSIHGDWINGWDEATMRAWVERCDVAALDCHAHLLGDGREIFFDPERHQVEPIMREGSRPLTRPRN